jgi:threonine dehydratase
MIGVQTSRLASMVAAREADHPVTVGPATTIADGIAVRRSGDVTFPVVERYVDEIVTVDEDEIASAILMLLEREKTLAEGAGATALAAVLQGKTSIAKGAKTAVLVSGGNIDVTLLSRIIERGLVQDGRMIRLRIHLLDKPGALHDLTRLIAEHRANIVDTLHNRAYYGVNLGETVIDITMETRGREQVEELLAALTAEGYKHSRVI